MLRQVARRLLGIAAGRRWSQSAWGRLEALSLRGQGIGGGTDVLGSGETAFLEAFFRADSAQRPLVVLDVGANCGDYTAEVLAASAGRVDCRVVAFEPGKAAFEVLSQRFGDRDDVMLVKSAVSDREGKACLHYDRAGSGLSSLYERRLTHMSIALDHSEAVDTVDLDTWSEAHAITCIDLLKLDVEGAELSVLQGAGALLARGAVGAIQFEFGGCNIDSRTFARDLWYTLSPSYRLYRVLRDGLWPIPEYEERLERFVTTNYVALRKGD